jgi:hypothetical protein
MKGDRVMRSKVSGRLLAIAVVVITFTLGDSAWADPITIMANTDWNDSNHNRVYQGLKESDGIAWMELTPDYGVTEWIWMDIGKDWKKLIPSGQTIQSATLTFPNAWSFRSGSTTFSVFEVQGDGSDKGMASVMAYAPYNNLANVANCVGFYGDHTAFGAVTTAAGATDPNSIQISAAFDVTNLLKGWLDGTLNTNPGQMMIMGNTNDFYVNWNLNTPAGSDIDAYRPTLMVTTAPVPEPSTIVLLTLGLLGLLAYGWRKRR